MVLLPVYQGRKMSDYRLSSLTVFSSTCTNAFALHAASRGRCPSIRMAAVAMCSSDVNP